MMRSTTLLATTLAALAFGMVACGASANTIFSDSFETPDIGFNGYVNYPDMSTITTGAATWQVSGSGGVDIIRNDFAPLPFPDGQQAIDLNGWEEGSISTSIPTTDGAAYSLGFYLAANSNVTVTATTTVGAGVTTQTFTSDSTAWTFHSMDFAGAAGGSTTISFTSNGPTGTSGPTLDMVTVNAVPLPKAAYAGMGLLAGIALVGAAKRRRAEVA